MPFTPLLLSALGLIALSGCTSTPDVSRNESFHHTLPPVVCGFGRLAGRAAACAPEGSSRDAPALLGPLT